MSRKNLKRQPRGGAILTFHGTEHRHGGFVTHIHSNRKRKGQLISLADYKAQREHRDTRQLPVLPGWSMSEWCNYTGEISYIEVPDDYLSDYDIHAGDLVVLMETKDVQDLDLAYKLIDKSVHVGECRTSRGRVVIENRRHSFDYPKSDLDGRAVGVMRNGHYVPIAFAIRPLITDADAELGRIKPANDLIN